MGFLTLFFLSGLSLIIFGITIPTPFGDYLTMKGVAFPVNYTLRIAILSLLLIMTASHFFAITKENHRLLTLLGMLFIILFMVEFILAIIYFTMASEVNVTKKKLSNGMQMLAEYGVDEKVTQAFDQIQRTYACCGISDYRDWFTSKWAAAQGKNNRVPSSCCKFPAPTCGYDMDTKNPIDVINILGCSGLHFSYEDRKKFVGGVGLAIGLFNLFALLCCIIFTFCFNSARGISAIDALKGAEPGDDPVGRGTSSSTPGSTRRPPPKSALRASKEMLTEDDDDDDLPLDAYKDLRDKSQM